VPGDARALVCFGIDDQELGVAIEEVKETIEVKPITRLFLVPDFVAGLINLRGDVVAVIDLARLLGLTARLPGADTRIVILRGRAAGKPAVAGLLVDRLTEVREVDRAALRPPPATVSPEAAAFVAGVARVGEGASARPLLVLDLAKMLDCEPLRAFRRQRA
jgi:purine-binding chemotaxis protein CheW